MSPDLIVEITAALRATLPTGVALSLGSVAGHQPALLGDEIPLAAPMVEKRRQEFMAGRAHARVALKALGVMPQAIPVGSSRAPIWPAGFVGSISHAGELVAAVAAPARLMAGIGVDLEPATPLADDLLERVCLPDELARLRHEAQQAPDRGPAHAAKLIFSAKESVYKCIAPRLGIFLEFADLEILPDRHQQEFSTRGHGPTGNRIAPPALSGRFVEIGGYWMTVAWQDA